MSQIKLKPKYAILLTSLLLILASDQMTKALVLKHFTLGESQSVWDPFFQLTYVQNKGAAFGLLSRSEASFRVPFFIIVPSVALFSLVMAFRKVTVQERRLALALSLVMSGALGNLIDRLVLGYVVDFLDFHWHWMYHFPAFNIADSAICIGVGMMMIDLLLKKEEGSDSHRSKQN